jgi:ubiquinone/menaquinone biosynthesis C-methylase UbiE
MSNLFSTSLLIDANYIVKKAMIAEAMSVADLGCGASGHFVFPTARAVGKNGRVFAVDILKNVLENINKRIKLENWDNISTVWSDLEIFGATKIESSSLDCAYLINTLYQSHKRAEIIREAVRLVKKGGHMLVVEWKSIAVPFGPLPDEKVKKDSVLLVAKRLGLTLEEEFDAGQYHYGVLFVK